MTLHLLVNAPTGTVTGSGDITQAIAPPDSDIPVTKIHGKLVHVGPHIVVNLEGTGLHTFPPPAIGTAEGPVHIHLVLNDKWEGHGSYTYFGHDVNDVPVKQIP